MSKTLWQVISAWPHDVEMTGEEAHSKDCRRCQIERWAREQFAYCQRELDDPWTLQCIRGLLGLPKEKRDDD